MDETKRQTSFEWLYKQWSYTFSSAQGSSFSCKKKKLGKHLSNQCSALPLPRCTDILCSESTATIMGVEEGCTSVFLCHVVLGIHRFHWRVVHDKTCQSVTPVSCILFCVILLYLWKHKMMCFMGLFNSLVLASVSQRLLVQFSPGGIYLFI